MVYCGKASRGCQHCRTRRIKCDKLRPECSQCARAGKQCPGYRDQLSLMFRDENSKVMQKAHAQWGVPGSSDSPFTLSTSPSSSGSPFSFVTGDGSPIHATPISRRSSAPSSAQQALVTKSRLPKVIQPTLFEKGVQFYIDRYIIGYPQEPRAPTELHDAHWMSTPAFIDVMAAVGLCGLSNLTGDKELDFEARQKYGLALRSTAKLIQNPAALDPRTAIRTVVLLAVFEVVQGTSETAGVVRAHIMGAAALLSSIVPSITQPTVAIRGVIQLCFSMLIPCQMSGISVPETAIQWILLSKQSLPPDDKPSAELLLIISRFLQLSAGLQGRSPTDGTDRRSKARRFAKLIDAELAAWEYQQLEPGSIWTFTTEDATFPTESAFRDRYHIYQNGIWAARVWNHYRWARILVNETITDLDDENTAPELGHQHLETIRRLAEDLIVSLPTQFRHPRLTREHRDLLDRSCTLPSTAGGGVQSSSMPSLMVQLKVACTAPGVPNDYGEWVLGVLGTIWSETGMLQAQVLASQLRRHLEQRDRVKVEVVEVKEERTI